MEGSNRGFYHFFFFNRHFIYFLLIYCCLAGEKSFNTHRGFSSGTKGGRSNASHFGPEAGIRGIQFPVVIYDPVSYNGIKASPAAPRVCLTSRLADI